jgi:CubicO group peptidase (beta-lactamase class C family)
MCIMSRRGFLAGVAAGPMGIAAMELEARAVAGQRDNDFDPREKKAMEDAAAEFMGKYKVPGFSVAIAKDGKLVYAEGFGMADTAGEKLTPRHRFRIASVSKPITSVTIMSLIEQTRLGLSERVFGKGGVLGLDFGTPPYRPHVEEITIEHLLTHTAGGWDNQGPDPDPMFTNPSMNHARLISWTLDNLPIRHTPGEHHAYSNFGFCLLGRVIEKRAGVGYAAYVRDNILRRCGISAMEIAGNTLADRRPLEVVYYGQKGEDPYGMQVARMDSHGGWIATPTDLVRFLVRVDGFATKPDILKPETLRTMTTGSSANSGYAKGWMVNKQDNWWHNGSLPGSTTLMVRTSGGFCWAALTNTRQLGSGIDLALDKLIWNMVGKVTSWPTLDLF